MATLESARMSSLRDKQLAQEIETEKEALPAEKKVEKHLSAKKK